MKKKRFNGINKHLVIVCAPNLQIEIALPHI